MRPIDADELKITLTNWIRLHWDETFTAGDMAYAFLEMINEELTLKMKSVVHAHWIKSNYDNIDGTIYKCSNCNAELFSAWNYCPNCGAKMDEIDMESQQKDGAEGTNNEH